MIMRIKLISGDEQDALSKRAKKYYSWRPGERKKIKRGYNKRFRKSFRFDEVIN